MVSFLLQLHNFMVPLVLVAGGATLLAGIAYFFVHRSTVAAPAGTAEAAPSANGTLNLVQRVFRILLAVTAGLGVLQAIIGGLLVTQGCSPRDALHYVYGIIVLAAIPVAYVYSDQKQVRRDIIIMTIAAVAIVGAAFRALATGPGGICH
ncbi:MAG TPA: hypothetical protein VF510_11160 [Ktedonobacterales bacterium]